MAIKTKQELLDYINTNINTNGAQAITGTVLNTFLTDFVESNLIEKTEAYINPSEVIAPEVDSALFDAGVNDATLPLVADYKERGLVLANVSGGSVIINRAGGDLIEGNTSLTLPDNWSIILIPVQASNEWRLLSVRKPEYNVLAFQEANPNTTVIGTSGVPFAINCSLAAETPSPVFTVSGATIIYTGAIPLKFGINYTINGMASGTNRNCRIDIYRDFGGADIKLAGNGKGLLDNGDYGQITMNTQVLLVQGDELTVTVTNDENNNNLDITDVMVSITEIL